MPLCSECGSDEFINWIDEEVYVCENCGVFVRCNLDFEDENLIPDEFLECEKSQDKWGESDD